MANLEPVRIEITLRENAAKGLKEIRDASKDVDSGVKKTAGSFREVDSGLQKTSAFYKNAIAAQRQLIREITGDINVLKAAAKDEAPGAGLTEILGDLKGARQALAEEQATLIGLQREQLEVNGEEKESNEGVVESLKNWAIGAATVGTALTVFNAVVSSTRATSDKFEVAIAGAKSGLDFFWKTLATGDWKDFFSNMDRAVRTGYKYAKMMDTFKESKWALDLAEADSLAKISELEDNLRNKQLPRAERKAAGDERIKIEEELSAKRTANAKIAYDAEVLVAQGRTKLSEETILGILKGIDKEGAARAQLHNENLDRVKSLQSTMNSQVGQGQIIGAQFTAAKIKKLTPGLQVSEKVEKDAAALRKMGETTDEMVDKLIDSYGKVKEAEDSGVANTERVRSMVHSLAASEEKEMAKKIDLIEQTKTAMETATGAELTVLAKKLTLLEAEKKLRDDIVKLVLFEAKYGENYTKADLSTPISGKTGQLVATKKPTKGTPQDLIDTSKASVKRNQKQINDLTDEENDRLKEQAQLRDDILNAAGELTGSLVEQGLLSEEQGAAIGKTLDGFKSLASGDFVGAAMNIVSQIASLFPTQAEAFQDRIDKINTALDYQRRLIELSDRQGGQEVGRLKEIELLKEKQKADEEALARAESKRSGKIFKIGPVYKGYVKDVKELTAAVLEDKQAVEDATMALGDFYTGGTTEIDISGAIRNGFEDSKSSAEDFAGTFEDFMRTAIDSSLEELSKPEIALWYKKFAADMASGGGLDEKEKVRLKAEWDKIIADNNARRTAAYGVAGIDPMKAEESATATGMRGDIQRMTEETGSALSGNISAIRINVARLIESGITSMTMVQKSLEYQLRTADNTDVMSKTLGSIDTRLSRLELDGIKVK